MFFLSQFCFSEVLLTLIYFAGLCVSIRTIYYDFFLLLT